ncbi:MAG: glycosyltransferase family 4 protein [Planctomycetota bacterium]
MVSRRAAKNTRDSAGRVLILVENLSVPFDRRVWREATALTEKGYQVTVICPRGKQYDRKKHEVIDNISIYRCNIHEADTGLLSYIYEYTQAIVKMMFLSIVVFFKEGFDVIQTCNPPDLLFFVALPYKLLGRKIIFDHHDLSPETYLAKVGNQKPGITHRILSILERITFATADVVMSTNESYKQIATSRGGRDQRNVIVVRNGPDLKRVRTVKENPELRRGKKHLIFYIGTMGAQDGVDFLLRSVEHLVHDSGRKDFHVLVMGGGTELDKVKDYASELAIDDVTEFTGRVPDERVIEALSTADVCVCPDPKTQLNDISTMNKTLEYMALAKPLVAFDLKETRVSAGDAALYAAANDEKDFADKIAELLDSEDLRRKLGETGRQRIEQGLSWEHSKKRLYEAYALALGKPENYPQEDYHLGVSTGSPNE